MSENAQKLTRVLAPICHPRAADRNNVVTAGGDSPDTAPNAGINKRKPCAEADMKKSAGCAGVPGEHFG